MCYSSPTSHTVWMPFINTGQLCHLQTVVQTMPTHLCTCALVFRRGCIDIQQNREKSPFSHSLTESGDHFLSFFCACVCVSFHAPVLCFLAINSGGLWKQVAESNSQQMPPHKVKISLQAVYETNERNTTRERRLPFMSESQPYLSFLYHLLSNVGEYYKSTAAVHLDCLQFGGCFVLVCLHFSHCW